MPKSDAMNWEAFLAGVGAKDKLNIEKHLAVIDAEGGPGHGRTWRQLALALRRLAPAALQTVGQHVVQFFIPDGKDGKYRMQVFTLEDQRDGRLLVYLPDVTTEAFKTGVLAKPTGPGRTSQIARTPVASGNGRGGAAAAAAAAMASTSTAEVHVFPIKASKGEVLEIESLDGSNTPDPPAHIKHMLGWNRKALRITLPTVAAGPQANATEALCEIAAKAWAGKLKV